jgi:signal transduction histidine kinase
MMSALKVDHLDELPPLSYMIAPVMQGKKVLGAIRCCSMLAPPFIFASRDVALLKVAAALMGSYWSTRTEIRVWRNFVTRLRGLNEAAEEELAKLAPEQGEIRRACQAVGQEFSGPKDEILGEMHRLVEQQEHLYLSLAENIGGRIAAQAELQTNMQAQKSTYEDLFHQIKSPIHSAIETIRATLEGSASRDGYRSGLEALRSQIRRANRISRAVGIFGELSAGNEITANRGTRLQAAAFHKAVTELGEDYERMQETYRKIRFVVEPKGFDVLRNHEVWVDEDLLFHALANVLDNAGKYSYAEAKVRVFAGLTGGQRFHVSVANRGIRIRQSELPHLIERRFRGEDAVSVTGEGSGIGLWLVQKIMDAHSGELIIVPANQPGDTEFKLLFPATKAPPPQDNYADSHR